MAASRPGFKGFKRFLGWWYRRFAARSFIIPLRGMENRTTGLRPLEMHPYPRLRRYFPRRGKFALRSTFELISISRHSAAKISPSGGDAAAGGRRGAFPRPQGGWFVFHGRSPVVWFSLLCCHKLNLTPPHSTHSAPFDPSDYFTSMSWLTSSPKYFFSSSAILPSCFSSPRALSTCSASSLSFLLITV